MASHIDCYIDLNSIYSYFAFIHLHQYRESLKSHGVTVNFLPVYLPDLQQRSGNRVIWTVKARQEWLEKFELPRSRRDFGVPSAQAPNGNLNNLFGTGQTLLPLRALLAVRGLYGDQIYESTWYWLYSCFWTPPQQRIKDEGPLRKALQDMPHGFSGNDGGKKDETKPHEQFNREDVDRILEAAKGKEMKDELRRYTDEALATGGFGAPWMMVRNPSGVTEPFFGSDRFAQIYEFLGLPFHPLMLLPANLGEKPRL